jgi:hypothetical protein
MLKKIPRKESHEEALTRVTKEMALPRKTASVRKEEQKSKVRASL